MSRRMNLPNRLTMLRLCLVPVCMAVLLVPAIPFEAACGVGFALFALTSLTDMLDGKIARARGIITNFGKFMDPVADKFMVIGTLMALLFRMMRPDLYGHAYGTALTVLLFAAVVAVIFRELAITSLRLVLVNTTGKVVAANMLGKIKTVCQIVCVCVLLLEPLLEKGILHVAPGYPLAGIYPLSLLMTGVMLVFTVLSGAAYLRGGWKDIATDW